MPRTKCLRKDAGAPHRRGCAAYGAWLESRAASHGGKIDGAALKSLRKGHPDKVRCAARARLRTAMENDWIAARMAMGGSTYVSSPVNRLLRHAKERRTLATHERALDERHQAVAK